MAKLTLSIFEPIEIVIGKQKFSIERISSKLLGELQAVTEGLTDPTKIRAGVLADVLMKAIPGMTKEVAMEIDIRHVPMIVQFLAEQINVALEPPKAGGTKKLIEARTRAIAEIATAFPGLFSYEVLLSMDVRDFYWWERKGRIANVRKKIEALGNMRLATNGESESFDRYIRDLSDQIELWEYVKPADEQVLANWNARMTELKTIVRRR